MRETHPARSGFWPSGTGRIRDGIHRPFAAEEGPLESGSLRFIHRVFEPLEPSPGRFLHSRTGVGPTVFLAAGRPVETVSALRFSRTGSFPRAVLVPALLTRRPATGGFRYRSPQAAPAERVLRTWPGITSRLPLNPYEIRALRLRTAALTGYDVRFSARSVGGLRHILSRHSAEDVTTESGSFPARAVPSGAPASLAAVRTGAREPGHGTGRVRPATRQPGEVPVGGRWQSFWSVAVKRLEAPLADRTSGQGAAASGGGGSPSAGMTRSGHSVRPPRLIEIFRLFEGRGDAGVRRPETGRISRSVRGTPQEGLPLTDPTGHAVQANRIMHRGAPQAAFSTAGSGFAGGNIPSLVLRRSQPVGGQQEFEPEGSRIGSVLSREAGGAEVNQGQDPVAGKPPVATAISGRDIDRIATRVLKIMRTRAAVERDRRSLV